MGDLRLTFIGSGNAFAPGGLCWNGFVVNERYLFEAPPQALMSLHHVGIDPNDIDAVVLSHHHGDHFLGMPSLLLHWKYYGRTRPIRVIGPPQTRELTERIGKIVYPGLFDIGYEIEWVTPKPGEPICTGDLVVDPVEVEHDDRLSQSLGFACAIGRRRFAYTGDSKFCQGVIDLARHGEVLISECASRAENIPVHMNLLDDIPRVRAAMPAEAHLILTHIAPDVTANGLENTRIARDYKTYRF